MTEMDSSTTSTAATEAADTNALLLRVLKAVEKDRQRGRLEWILAIILSLATLASTWCGYQARLWGGIQGNHQAAADTAERKSAEDTIVGLQSRTFDAMEINAYWTALRQKDTETAEALLARMRPQLRTAVEASLAAGVLHNPEVPGPLKQSVYILPEEVEAKRLRTEAAESNAIARTAGNAAGKYVLLTLMFASVLFFGGITGTFTARRVRTALGIVALILFITTLIFLVGLPVSKG